MNCPKCECVLGLHGSDGCYGCNCKMTPDGIEELAELNARLTLASRLIDALTFNKQMSPNLMTPDARELFAEWTKETK